MTLSRFDFPPGFLFGAATAAYQIEGSAHGGCGPCHWDTFAAAPGNVLRAEDGATACDHYHQWPADLDLLRQAGLGGERVELTPSEEFGEPPGHHRALPIGDPAREPVAVDDGSPIDTSFPGFAGLMNGLGAKIESA